MASGKCSSCDKSSPLCLLHNLVHLLGFGSAGLGEIRIPNQQPCGVANFCIVCVLRGDVTCLQLMSYSWSSHAHPSMHAFSLSDHNLLLLTKQLMCAGDGCQVWRKACCAMQGSCQKSCAWTLAPEQGLTFPDSPQAGSSPVQLSHGALPCSRQSQSLLQAYCCLHLAADGPQVSTPSKFCQMAAH